MSNARKERTWFLSCLLIVIMGSAGCGSGLDNQENNAVKEEFGAQPLSEGVAIQIDATALSNPSFNVDGFQWYPRASVLTLNLLPGKHDFMVDAHAAGRIHVFFTVTAAGTVDYAPEDDAILGGRGTSTLLVKGVTVRVDATALSNPSFNVDGFQWYPRTSVLTMTLLPGKHVFLADAHAAGQIRVFFTVAAAGTVDYAPEDDAILGGRGTSTLLVKGVTIRVDATALSNPSFNVDGFQWYPRTSVLTMTLLPGKHVFLADAYAAGQIRVFFTVTAAGTVDYAPEDDVILGGRGTSTLLVKGTTVRIDASALSAESFNVDGFQWYPGASVLTMTLLPGKHDFFTSSNSAGVNHTWFVIKQDRTIDYEPALDGALAGRGTNALLVRGSVILVDARSISGGLLSVDASGWLTTSFMTPYALMPGHHDLRISTNGTTWTQHFDVSTDGTVSYAPDADGTVFSGSGTDTLVVLSTLHVNSLQDPADSTPQVRFEGALDAPLDIATPAHIEALPRL